MIRNIVAAVALLAFGPIAESAAAQMVGTRPASSTAPVGVADTVHIAPPTGDQVADRASILTALAQVQPGDVIQFAPGTYVVGEIIPIETAQLTMLGHGDGTTLRGCHPGAYERMGTDVEAAGGDQWARMTALLTCGVFEMTGGLGTIRGLTFEYTAIGLVLGAGHSDSLDFHLRPGRVTEGGYLVENNVFRNSANGVRPGNLSSVPTVIRGNRFMNLVHALSGDGVEIHVSDNHISVPDPRSVLSPTGPLFAIGISGAQQSVFEGNRIEGHPVGIALFGSSNRATRHNVIRGNILHGVSFPLVLWGEEGVDDIVIENNLIEHNRIRSAAGVGIALNRASSNRILDNTISGIEMRDSSLAAPFDFGEGNGSGIWVSPGSDENEIVGNVFEDIATHAIVLGGARNVVETRGVGDAVRDLGSGNRVNGPAGAREPTADPPPSGILEAGRLVFHQLLHPVGEETYTLAREGDAYVLHADFNHNDRGQRTERSVTLHLGPDLAPRASQLREIADGDTTETAVEVNGRLATVTDASGSRRVAVPDRFFTTTAFAPHAVQALLVRYWLRNGRPASIPVLPRGNAVVRHVGLDTLEVGGETVALDRYHVDGVRWGGQTLWLDSEERLVAAVSFDFNYQAVREGYEGALAFFSERARRDVLTRAEAASRRIAPLHTGTFALVGGALIDGTGAPPLADAAVVVRDGRITAVGPRASVTIPADAEVVDVTGTTLLPGLWDMHAHLAGITDFGPIYLATGVTTVRDVGNETDWGLALREAFATDRIAGPRLLLAAEIDGRVPEAVGAIQADTPEEARALVRHFHDLGFEQIKLYSRFRPELVPVIAQEAHGLGMTVTGHVPWGMSTTEALQAGMDQINHLSSVAAIGNMIPATIRESRDVAGALTWLADLDLDLETRSLVDTLIRHGTVVDPTLAAFELRSRPANVPLHEIEPGAARMPPVVANTIERWFPGRPADVAELDDALQQKNVELVGILHRAGVPIVAGTDVVVPGHSLHRELELYVEAGMTPVEAIQAATIVPARAMGLDHDVGTVEVGKRADLIVVDGDPLRSIREIRNVRAAIANGRIFDTDALWRSVGFETRDQP